MRLNHLVIDAHVDRVSCRDRRAKVKSEGKSLRNLESGWVIIQGSICP